MRKIISLFRDYSFSLSEAKYIEKNGRGLKILTPKQMFQRLPIARAQVKAVNTSENVLSKVRKIIYPLYRANEITKKTYYELNKVLKQNG